MIAKKWFLIAVILLAGAMPASATLNLPVKQIGNDAYYYYKVGKNETVQSVASKIGVSVQDVIHYNPSSAQGITKNQLLFFPVTAYVQRTVAPAIAGGEQVTHVVKNGETLYGISKLYGITADELCAANPGTESGLKSGEVIVIPNQNGTTSALTSGIIYHTIEQGETPYSVSHQYNTTIESLLELNPGIYPNSFIAGDVIKVKPNTAQEITVKKDVKQFYVYTVKNGDTFESVASANGISVKELTDANPNVKKLKKGKTIYVPRDGQVVTTTSSSNVTAKELEQTYADKMDEVYGSVNKIASRDDEVINIAIVLPFQLQKSTPPRQAHLYTDFYKGFLLAADSIGSKVGKHVNVNVFDTQHNLDVTDSLLSLPQMKQQDVIIAPGEPKQLKRCNDFGKRNGITVINCFSPKNDDYVDNALVAQINMPTSYMTAAVNSWIDKTFGDYCIVFLDDHQRDDHEVSSNILNHIKAGNQHYKEISVLNDLSYATLTQYLDPGSKYLFVPSSGSKALLGKVAEAIKEAKQQRFDCEIAMLGYPEYLTLMSEYRSTFQSIDTYVFSRFFTANQNRAAKVEKKFKDMFGTPMISTTPSMGLMGFDMGMYLITSLSQSNQINAATPYYDGIQSDIQFRRSSNWGGLINRCVEIVHIDGTGMHERIIK